VVCTLTFDDGPDPTWTPCVLTALDAAGARATFFVLGERAIAHPTLVARMREAGHEVQVHGDAHLRHPDHDRETLVHDTETALRHLDALGVRPSLWRLPWGRPAPWSAELAGAYGLRVVGWDADTHDWRGDDAATMLAAVAPQLDDGCVVLAHDALGPGCRRDGCEQTVALIGPLVDAARERGLTCRPLSENPTALQAVAGDALTQVAARAAARDRDPRAPFPTAAIAALEAEGLLGRLGSFAQQLALVRDVARADAGVSRIVDGHVNAMERLAVQAEPVLRDAELAATARSQRRLGVWGADPRPGEGEPARIDNGRMYGVKTFCSGAGGLDRALVLAGRRLAYVDVTQGAAVDDRWFAGAGMRASASHRVRFQGAPVLAVLGGQDALLEQPWFARDAVRTAATWAGTADAAADAALALLAGRDGELAALAAGRIVGEQRTIELWLDEAARRGDAGTLGAADAAHAREAIAAAARRLLDEAARACGSHAFVTGGRLDRARRDLDLFLLQHRLDPIVARAGRAALDQRA
jgi:peptidoglycan/xylan/chitin deacetylase (PgdA/CDA1 family)